MYDDHGCSCLGEQHSLPFSLHDTALAGIQSLVKSSLPGSGPFHPFPTDLLWILARGFPTARIAFQERRIPWIEVAHPALPTTTAKPNSWIRVHDGWDSGGRHSGARNNKIHDMGQKDVAGAVCMRKSSDETRQLGTPPSFLFKMHYITAMYHRTCRFPSSLHLVRTMYHQVALHYTGITVEFSFSHTPVALVPCHFQKCA